MPGIHLYLQREEGCMTQTQQVQTRKVFYNAGLCQGGCGKVVNNRSGRCKLCSLHECSVCGVRILLTANATMGRCHKHPRKAE